MSSKLSNGNWLTGPWRCCTVYLKYDSLASSLKLDEEILFHILALPLICYIT